LEVFLLVPAAKERASFGRRGNHSRQRTADQAANSIAQFRVGKITA
jgi:hypothetical protein